MNKKQLKGKIVSNKMKKTVVIEVESIKKNQKYNRRYKCQKNYKAHDEKGECKIGDEALIEECRPISKDKKWRVVKIMATSKSSELKKEPEESIFEENLEENESKDELDKKI